MLTRSHDSCLRNSEKVKAVTVAPKAKIALREGEPQAV